MDRRTTSGPAPAAVLRRHADRDLADAERSVLLPGDLDDVSRKHANVVAVMKPGAAA